MGATQPMSKVYANKMLKAVGAQNLRNFLTNFNTNYSPCKAETAVFSLVQFQLDDQFRKHDCKKVVSRTLVSLNDSSSAAQASEDAANHTNKKGAIFLF